MFFPPVLSKRFENVIIGHLNVNSLRKKIAVVQWFLVNGCSFFFFDVQQMVYQKPFNIIIKLAFFGRESFYLFKSCCITSSYQQGRNDRGIKLLSQNDQNLNLSPTLPPPRPHCLHLFDFGNLLPPPSNFQKFTTTIWLIDGLQISLLIINKFKQMN